MPKSVEFAGAEKWQLLGECRREDPELFFPLGNQGPAIAQTEEAKTVCRRCPVLDTCREWALRVGEDNGVWGGMAEDERRALRRRAQRMRRTAAVGR